MATKLAFDIYGTEATIVGSGSHPASGDLDIPQQVSSNGSDYYTVTTIGSEAFIFSGFTGKLTIPNSVTSIEESAFDGCSGLTSVTIPNSVTFIGDSAFSNCTGLTGDLTIPSSVTFIDAGAFSGCTGLTSVTIPNSVTFISDFAFSGCTGLTSVTIPNSVTVIEYGAFQGCSGLTSVTIPNSVTSIGNYAFSSCFGLTGDLTIPNSVTSIGGYAFSGCSGLTGDLIIPKSVTSFGNGVFTGLVFNNIYIADATYNLIKDQLNCFGQIIIFTEDYTISGGTSVNVGGTITLSNTITPSNANYSNITWSSSDSSIAVVDANGVVTGIADGYATITSTMNGVYVESDISGTKNWTSNEIKVKVGNSVVVTGVELSDTALTLDPGDSRTLTATVKPADASDKKVTWSSSDPSVVSVDSTGNIQALKVGTATITVTTDDGNQTASCFVTVEQSVSVSVKTGLQTDGKKGAPANLNSQKLKLVLTVKQNGVTYKSRELEVDTETLSEDSLDFQFPSGTPTFIWGAEVSLKGFSGSVEDKSNKTYQLSGVADINGKGEISLTLNFKKKTDRKISHGYPAWNLPEDEIGAYHIDPVTGQKEYLLFQTYNICMKYMENDEYCASYEHCFHKEEIGYEINWKK